VFYPRAVEEGEGGLEKGKERKEFESGTGRDGAEIRMADSSGFVVVVGG
jgi:hypothetical protein